MTESTVPANETMILVRLLDQNDQLLAIIPNLDGSISLLNTLNQTAAASGELNRNGVAEVLRQSAAFTDHGEISQNVVNLLKESAENQNFKINRVSTPIAGLMRAISQRKGSREETDAFIELLNQGQVRAAEKVRGVWVPQTYVIDGILNFFGSHPNERLEQSYWDKVPLKYAHYTDEDFAQSGVRYAPGAIVRTGAYIGPQTVLMNQAFVNIGAYIAGKGVMIDGASRVASCAQIGEGVKFGAGSGIEGVLEPAGRLASIIEDHVKIGAMCEVAGIVEQGAIVASGVVMASGKKIFDEDTGEVVPPLECKVGEKVFQLPRIPAYRLAVGGSLRGKSDQYFTDAVILKAGDLRDRDTLRHFEKQGILYS